MINLKEGVCIFLGGKFRGKRCMSFFYGLDTIFVYGVFLGVVYRVVWRVDSIF